MDNLHLLMNMVSSQNVYVLSHIEKDKNKAIYLSTVLDFQEQFNLAKTYDEAKTLATKLIMDLRSNPPKWDFLGNKLKYRTLAIDHIKDIIHSINTRFVNGGSKAYDIW